MGESELPAWVSAAIPAAVRLAAEAGTEVDDVLRHAATDDAGRERLARQAGRLEQSAELTEVATDLAGLLWAECEDVPRIATILEEPAAQAALEAVAEARRLAADRLAAGAFPSPRQPAILPAPLVMTAAPASPAEAASYAPEAVADARCQADHRLAAGTGEARRGEVARPQTTRPIRQHSAEADEIDPPAAVPAPVGPGAAAVSPLPVPPAPPAPTTSSLSGSSHQPATGALLAGVAAAAAILLFGRRLRRA